MSESRKRRALLIGAIGGAVAAGAATGLAAERRTVRTQRRVPDPGAREPYGRLPADRVRVVIADDGVRLHVEEVGPEDASLTVVFSHGFVLTQECWYEQRRALGDLGRLVFYDQRSHGLSDPSTVEHATIDQLGADLRRVLDDVAPTGPVVLVGHSMGGMSILALADAHPEIFGTRIIGVALISTSAGRMAEVSFGLPAIAGKLLLKVRPWRLVASPRSAALLDRTRRHGSDLAYALTRRMSFGSEKTAAPSLVDFMERMVGATPFETMIAFAPRFLEHDKLEALKVLRSMASLVLVGDGDLLTPAQHSRDMAAALPEAELVVLPGAGHMVILERGPLVNLHLRALCARARRPAARVG